MEDDRIPELENPEGSEIPPLLHSVYEEGPFTQCSVCDTSLLEEGVLYEIQKVFRGAEVIFECAVCGSCAAGLIQAYSKESLKVMQEFFESSFRPDNGPDRCHFCGGDGRAGRDDVVVMGMCMGPVLMAPPVVICEACGESLNERLSKKTKESYGEFIENNFPGVPAEWEAPVAPLGF